jgi:hypothetical protein
MKTRLDLGKIARALGARRRGKVSATSGYFGAQQLLAEVTGRFRVPSKGGRPTDPKWTKRRLVPLAPETLEWLERVSADMREHARVNVEPMQVAGLLLERTMQELGLEDVERVVLQRAASHRASGNRST